jgi:hypothetical protein
MTVLYLTRDYILIKTQSFQMIQVLMINKVLNFRYLHICYKVHIEILVRYKVDPYYTDLKNIYYYYIIILILF